MQIHCTKLRVLFPSFSIIMIMETSSRRLWVKPDRRTRFSVPRPSSLVCSRWDTDDDNMTGWKQLPLNSAFFKFWLLVCAETPFQLLCYSCSTSCFRTRDPTWTGHHLTSAASRSWPVALPSPLASIRSRPERPLPHCTSKTECSVLLGAQLWSNHWLYTWVIEEVNTLKVKVKVTVTCLFLKNIYI